VDGIYTAIIKALREKSQNDLIKMSENPCRNYISEWGHLGLFDYKDATLLTLDEKRLLVPMSQHQSILKILHPTHQGIIKTYAAARSRY